MTEHSEYDANQELVNTMAWRPTVPMEFDDHEYVGRHGIFHGATMIILTVIISGISTFVIVGVVCYLLRIFK